MIIHSELSGVAHPRRPAMMASRGPILRRAAVFLLCVAGMILFGVTLSNFGAVSPESDHVVETSVLEDAAGVLDIEQAVTGQYEPFGSILSEGYTDSVFWVRLKIRKPEGGGKLALRIRPTFLDRIVLFQRSDEAASGWVTQVTGDLVPFDERPRPTVALGFEVEPVADIEEYYLRLQTRSSSMLRINAVDNHTAQTAEFRSIAILMVFFAAIGGILLWTINEYLVRPEPLIAWFAVAQTAYLLFALSLMGFLAVILPSRLSVYGDTATTLLVHVGPLCTYIFDVALIRLFGPRRLLPLFCVMIGGFVVAVLGLYAVGAVGAGLHVNAYFILLGVPVFLAMAIAPDDGPVKRPRLLRTIYGLQAVAMVITMTPLLGYFDAAEWTIHSVIIHGFVYVLLMFVLLHSRSREVQDVARRRELELNLANQALIEAEQAREQQNRFVAMLTHEIKTPISVIKLSIDREVTDPALCDAIDEALQDIEGIIDRCNMADQLDSEHMELVVEPLGLHSFISGDLERLGQLDRVRLDIPATLEIESDRRLLNVIVSNLVENAVRYAPSDTPIAIAADASRNDERNGVLITVGNALADGKVPDQSRVFDKYYRGPGARAKSGSGLGLYVVQGLVDLLGGEVACVVNDQSIAFSVWMPLRMKRAEDAAGVEP
ncbi:7TM-DISM domain-containing protein [Oricola sp.]|uniref:sensor histidine kinase n=1 Tax=Oricola sp. TaxID=1979950 RepID=UPI0025CF1867|nr:7TM-DISM domain-containing protein [Oricola sp.]MCI5076509.1 ATP-binding protein [Oricola sp.]